MIKVSRVLRRRRNVTAAAFKAHWTTERVALMRRLLQDSEGVLRYAQSHPLPMATGFGDGADDEIDCFEEFWLESFDAAVALFDSEPYRVDLAPREEALLDHASSEVVAGTVHRVLDRLIRLDEVAVKMQLLGVRRPGLSAHQFRRYWLDVHSKLALASPTLQQPQGGPRRIEFCGTVGLCLGSVPVSGYDGVVSIWFNEAGDLQREFGSEYYRAKLQPDEPRFSDRARSRGVLTRESLVWELPGLIMPRSWVRVPP